MPVGLSVMRCSAEFRWVCEHTTIKECPVHVANHGPACIRERKKHRKKTHITNFRGSQGGVPGVRFWARVLHAGVILSNKIQCIHNFKGGGSEGQGRGSKVQILGVISLFYVLFRDLMYGVLSGVWAGEHAIPCALPIEIVLRW